MTVDKIYVRMIDGTETLCPVIAEQVNDKCYKILNDEEYAEADPSVLFEFYPGDIVEVVHTKDLDKGYQYTAKGLVEAVNTDERKYYEFKFYATCYCLPIDEQTADKFRSVLERIKRESIAGQFFYRGIRDAVARLDRV